MLSNNRILSPLALLIFFTVALAFKSSPSLSPTETEIENIRAETYRLAVKENFEVESLLMPIPIGIATMVDLIVMASTLSDFSLEAHTPAGGFIFIKYPESFHASLQQISFSAHGAFSMAHINMNHIQLLAEEMSDKVESIERILESGEEQVIAYIIPEDLESIKEAAAQCSKLSNEVVDGFVKVIELTEEVSTATTALKGRQGNLNSEAEGNLNSLKLKKEESDKILRELEENQKKIEAEEADAQEQASKAMDEMPGAIKMIGLRLVDKIFNFFSNNTDLVDKIQDNAASKLKAAQDELAQVRAEVNEARFQRKKVQEEQLKILADMGKVKFDKNDYETAIDTLIRGMENLSTMYETWVRLRVFFATIENFINAKVVRSMKDVKKWSTARMQITSTSSTIEIELRKTTKKAYEHSLMVYHVATIYGEVSADYIMKPLNEWRRINSNVAGKSKEAIEADRQKVFQLCIEAGSGIQKVLEIKEKTFPVQAKVTNIEQQINRDEL